MAERPYVAGAVAIGVLAAALHLGSGSAPQAPAFSVSSGGSHIRHSLQKPESAFDTALWETEMKNHPENLGKITAEKELKDTLSDFYGQTGPSAAVTKAMIAIEPDPVHTHLPLFFDRGIDALEDALQASGYQYQSNWLPWSPPSFDSSSRDHFTGQEERRLFLQGRESYPGVILFRATEPTDKSLAVFVVADSPTGGIDQTQFEEALAQIQSLVHDQDELSILGPTFSGSGRSLRELLSGEAVAKLGLKQITVASGSVTDPDCTHFLPSNDSDTSCHWTNATHAQITFVSFGIDKDRRTDQIERFLHDQGHFKPDEVADLTEDESSYGLWSEKPALHDGSTHLYFPRNISHLSSAYQKNNILGFGVSSQGTTSLSLNLDLNEANDDDDVIPNFAEQQMPVSQDGVMHQITQALEQHHIKVIVLSATDVLDELFVAELLARQAPNALVVINQADNLFLRSSSPNDFANMYFVSPFPLIGPSKPGNRIFPSDLSEELYAAVQYLYATGHLNPVDPAKDPVPAVPDYSSPVAPTNRPALWLSAVGHGGYWPVAVLNRAEDKPSTFHLPTIPNQGPASAGVEAELPHLSQELLVICLCLLALYHTAKCFGVSAIEDFSFGYTIYDEDVRALKLCLQLCITGLLLLALLLSVSPAYHSLLAKYTLDAGVLLLSLTTAYLTCLIAASDGGPLLRWPLNEKSNNRGAANWFAFASCVAAVVMWPFVLMAWRHLWSWLTWNSGLPSFIQLRASYPLRGVSPVLPLFVTVIGFCILAYSHLDRIAFTKNLRPRLPKGIPELPDCPGETALDPVGDLLEWPPKKSTIGGKFAAVLGIMIFVFILLKPLHLKPQMFDGLRLQKSLGLTMFLLVTAILWELLMAGVLWHRLKKFCLEPLESSSLRRGFSFVRGLSWSSLWIFRGSLSSRYRLIHLLLQQASRAVLSDKGCLTENGANLAQKRKQLENAIAERSSLSEVAKAFGLLQEQIAAAAQELLTELRWDWHQEKGCITSCDATVDEEKGTELPSAKSEKPDALQQLREEWVALVYVHYVRMVLLHVRSRLMVAATLYVFLVWAATSYPYLNRHALLVALAAILGVLSFAVILIYASINRDHILSRVTNHTPGRLDLDFYLKTASLVGVPLIGFIASQFPEVSSFLFSWLEPGMAAVK